MKIMKSLWACAASLCLCGATSASADVISFDLNQTVEGSEPSGFPSATFEDTGADAVTLTLDLAGMSGGEFASSFFFNYDGNATALSFAREGGTGPSSGLSWDTGSNEFDSPGNQGLFDIFLGLSTSNRDNGALRFDADETLIFSITGAGLTAELFNIDSAAQRGGSNFALARVQGIAGGASASVGDGDGDPGEGNEIPVPEPGALGLLGLGIIVLGVARRRKRSV